MAQKRQGRRLSGGHSVDSEMCLLQLHLHLRRPPRLMLDTGEISAGGRQSEVVIEPCRHA